MKYKLGAWISTPKFYGKVVGFCRDEVLIEDVAGFRYWHKREQEMTLVKIEDLKVGNIVKTIFSSGTIESLNGNKVWFKRDDGTGDVVSTFVSEIIHHTPAGSRMSKSQSKDSKAGCKWGIEQFIVELPNPIATSRDAEATLTQARLVETEANQYARRNTKEFPTCGFGGKVEVKRAKEQFDPSKIKFVWFCRLCGSC